MTHLGRVGAGVGTVVACGLAAAFFLRPLAVLEAALKLRLWGNGARGRFDVVDGVRLYSLWAPARGTRASAPPLLLIHGLGAKSLDWAPLIPGLQDAGHDVIAVDLPGYGHSEKPRSAEYTITDQVRTMRGLLEIFGLTRVDVAGWSMGGWIAMQLAADAPELVWRLMLLDSAGMDFAMPYDASLLSPTDMAGLRSLLEHLTPKADKMPDFVARDLLRRMRQNGWVIRRSVKAMLAGEDLMQFRLGEIRQPTLIVWGEDDRLIPLAAGERMAEGIDRAQLVKVPGCGHLAPVECASDVLRAMTGFLADTGAAR